MKKKRHIVIVTYNWPPRNASGTHRPYSWAKYWIKNDLRITVLTAKKKVFDQPLDLNMPLIKNVKVIEVPYNQTFYNFLDKFLRFRIMNIVKKKIKNFFLKKLGSRIDPRYLWRKKANYYALKLSKDADIVVSTFGPSASHLIGYDMKKFNPKLFWVADYRDLWSQGYNNIFSKAHVSKIKNIELLSVGKYADLISTVSDHYAHKLQNFLGVKTIKVTNGFDLEKKIIFNRLKRKIVCPKGSMKIVYTGIVDLKSRNPKVLLSALASLYKKKIITNNTVTIDFYGSRIEDVKKLAKNPIYNKFIRIKGHVPRKIALKKQINASLLLLLESSDLSARGVVTGKIFEYITSGRPIICIGSKTEYEIGKILKETGTGRVFTLKDQKRIEDCITKTLKGNGLYYSFKPNIKNIMKYSRKNIALNFLKKLP